MLVLYFVILIK